jgi:serine/threonine protein kinase
VKVYFVSKRRLDSNETFALETAIVMEFCDQDTLRSRHEVIWELLQKDNAAGLRWIISCLLDIAGALEYMHYLGLVHGDLKCNNILLQSTQSESRGFTCKVADMGCSRLLCTSLEVLTGTFGAPCYAAPELMKDGSLTQVKPLYPCHTLWSYTLDNCFSIV